MFLVGRVNFLKGVPGILGCSGVPGFYRLHATICRPDLAHGNLHGWVRRPVFFFFFLALSKLRA